MKARLTGRRGAGTSTTPTETVVAISRHVDLDGTETKGPTLVTVAQTSPEPAVPDTDLFAPVCPTEWSPSYVMPLDQPHRPRWGHSEHQAGAILQFDRNVAVTVHDDPMHASIVVPLAIARIPTYSNTGRPALDHVIVDLYTGTLQTTNGYSMHFGQLHGAAVVGHGRVPRYLAVATDDWGQILKLAATGKDGCLQITFMPDDTQDDSTIYKCCAVAMHGKIRRNLQVRAVATEWLDLCRVLRNVPTRYSDHGLWLDPAFIRDAMTWHKQAEATHLVNNGYGHCFLFSSTVKVRPPDLAHPYDLSTAERTLRLLTAIMPMGKTSE